MSDMSDKMIDLTGDFPDNKALVEHVLGPGPLEHPCDGVLRHWAFFADSIRAISGKGIRETARLDRVWFHMGRSLSTWYGLMLMTATTKAAQQRIEYGMFTIGCA